MQSSDQIDKLAKSLTTAAGELTDPHRGRTAKTGSFSYKYASLPDILPAVRQTLSKHGLAILQECGELFCTTRLGHSSGQWIESLWPLEVDKGRLAGAQARGSAATYARRYSLLALLGMAADDDDDGAAASQKSQRVHRPVETPQRTVPVEQQNPCEFNKELPERLGPLLARVQAIGRSKPQTIARWCDARGWPDIRQGTPNKQRSFLKYISSAVGQTDLRRWLDELEQEATETTAG